MRTSRSFRQLAFRLIIPLIAILLVLCLFEIGLRAFGYNPLRDFAAGRDFLLRSSSDPNIDYELTPGAEGYAWRCNVKVNRHGFRDKDYAYEKPPGFTRMVVIGDSITFGNGLDMEDTYPEVLERLYEESNKKIEVLNLGVGGYNTINEVGFLEQTGLAFRPDVVIVGFCVNDIGVHSVNLATIRILDNYGPWVRSLRCLQFVTVQIDRRTVSQADYERLNRERVFRRQNADRVASIENDPKLETMMKRLGNLTNRMDPRKQVSVVSWFASPSKVGALRFALERLANLSRAHDFSVVVTLFPYLEEGRRKKAFRIAYNIVQHEVNRAGFQFLDLSRVLNAPDIGEVAQFNNPGRDAFHLNKRGHRIVAKRLYAELPKLLPAIVAP